MSGSFISTRYIVWKCAYRDVNFLMKRRQIFTRAMDTELNLQRAAEKIREADALVITAGAGMGVDSGLPDFRGPEGLWKAYPPIQKLGLSFSEMSNPEWFEKDPSFVWGFFGHRYHLYESTEPHRGFGILLEWAKSMKDGYFVFTSNIDGQFQKAGFPEDRIIECHGSIHYLQVTGGGCERIWSFPKDQKIEVDESTLRAKEPLPHGPPDIPKSKQSLARPNVLMFGDWTWVSDRTADQETRFQEFINQLTTKQSSFVIIEIGAGKAVPTVRFTGESLIRRYKSSTLIRINPREPEVPIARQISLAIGGLEALDKIKAIMESRK